MSEWVCSQSLWYCTGDVSRMINYMLIYFYAFCVGGTLVCRGTEDAWSTVATRAFGQLNLDAPHVIKSLVFPEQRYSDDVCKGGINVENVYLRFLQFFVNKMRNLIKFILFVYPYKKGKKN